VISLESRTLHQSAKLNAERRALLRRCIRNGIAPASPPSRPPLVRFAALQDVDMRRGWWIIWFSTSASTNRFRPWTCGATASPSANAKAMGSSPRELYASSEFPASDLPVFRAPSLGLRFLFATSVDSVARRGSIPDALRPRRFARPRRFTRCRLRGFVSPHCRVQDFLFRGFLPRHRRAISSTAAALSSLATASLPPVARRRHAAALRPQGFDRCLKP